MIKFLIVLAVLLVAGVAIPFLWLFALILIIVKGVQICL